MARRTKKARCKEEEDRISKLPDELIHQIMRFLDVRLVVQTSILSKRWKLLWTTLPFLNFNSYDKYHYPNKLAFYNTLKRVFADRNHEYQILQLDLHPPIGLTARKLQKYVKYATSHHVERMNIRSYRYCSLSTFNSSSLRELKLTTNFGTSKVMELDCWSLPSLNTLSLKSYSHTKSCQLPILCLTCLPGLTTLVLNRCVLPDSLGLPNLKTLCLESCNLPEKVWDFPALLTLQLSNVHFPVDFSEYILALGSLRNMEIDFGNNDIRCNCEISSSQLVNLKIRAILNDANAIKGKIVVWAPKLCNFSAVGFFWTTLKGCDELKRVNIKFWDRTMYPSKRTPSWVLKLHRDLFETMFSELGSAEILSVDLVILQALSEISEILDQLYSPFYNMKYLRLPRGCEESYISRSVRRYLLGRSPSATIVKT